MSKTFIGRFDDSMLEDMSEFEKRYSGTFLWIRWRDKPWELFQYDTVVNEGARFWNPEMGDIILKTNTEAEIAIRWPETRLFNHNNTFYWYNKLPDRQWKRAPCAKNSSITRPLMGLFHNRMPQEDLTFPLLRAAYEPTETKRLIPTINSFKKSDISGQALNNKFAVSLPPIRANYYLLWYLCRPVAKVNIKDKSIQIMYPLVRQEIADFIRDYEGNQWTIV